MSAQKKNQSEIKEIHRNLTGVDFEHVERLNVQPAAFALWIRQLLQNWRQGTVACKGRADVNLSNKKPWKQKGTGQARAGTARSPLWRGGGVTFGPQARVRTLKTNYKAKSAVLNKMLWDVIDQDKLVSLNWFLNQETPSTSAAYGALKQAGLHKDKVVVLVQPHDLEHYASFLNIPNAHVIFFDQVNAYDLANSAKWVVLEKDIEVFKQMVSTWI